MSNNKRRLLSLLKILISETDRDNPISESDLKRLLNEEGISINNRKTLYEDIKTLIDFDVDVYYDTKKHGYYLEEAPFSLIEIKILLDHVNSLKNFDGKDKLQTKLLGFISSSERQLLKDNQLLIREAKASKSKEKRPEYFYKYTDKLDIILESIKYHHYLNIIYNNKEYTVNPYFLYYSDSKYYLYVKFDDNKDIYQYRLDRITYLKPTDKTYKIDNKALEQIKRRIKTSTDNYSKKDITIIKLEMSRNYNELAMRLNDDFPEHYLDNRGNLILEYSINQIFFSKLVSYGTDLKIIEPQDVIKQYNDYLKKIINNY